MVKKSLVVLALVMAAFTGYVFGQKDVRPLAGGARVYAGDDFGFHAEGRVGDVSTEGRGWVTGKFVVKIEGPLGRGPTRRQGHASKAMRSTRDGQPSPAIMS